MMLSLKLIIRAEKAKLRYLNEKNSEAHFNSEKDANPMFEAFQKRKFFKNMT